MNEQFTKEELIILKDCVRIAKTEYDLSTHLFVEDANKLIDKLSHLIVASEIGCTKEVVFDWGGSKKE